jgi:multiple sugar transport system substrate-binding protein
MSIRKFLTGLTAGAGICALAALAPAAAAEFDGVTINVMTFTGPQIAEPLQRRAPDFEKATGAKVNVITVPFSDLYQKLPHSAVTAGAPATHIASTHCR